MTSALKNGRYCKMLINELITTRVLMTGVSFVLGGPAVDYHNYWRSRTRTKQQMASIMAVTVLKLIASLPPSKINYNFFVWYRTAILFIVAVSMQDIENCLKF